MAVFRQYDRVALASDRYGWHADRDRHDRRRAGRGGGDSHPRDSAYLRVGSARRAVHAHRVRAHDSKARRLADGAVSRRDADRDCDGRLRGGNLEGGDREITNSTFPTPSRSPLFNSARSTRAPFTKVPFVLSRSTTSRSAAPAVSRQWTRETSAASTMKSARAARPMVLIAPGRMRKVNGLSTCSSVLITHIVIRLDPDLSRAAL